MAESQITLLEESSFVVSDNKTTVKLQLVDEQDREKWINVILMNVAAKVGQQGNREEDDEENDEDEEDRKDAREQRKF